jgi:hypothetical protein
MKAPSHRDSRSLAVPAVSSCLITALVCHLAPLDEVAPKGRGGLLEVLESVPDPRKKPGVRHRFVANLFMSVCAVVSGARPCAAIAESAADAVDDTSFSPIPRRASSMPVDPDCITPWTCFPAEEGARDCSPHCA